MNFNTNVAYGTHERQVLDYYKAEPENLRTAAVLHSRRRLGEW
jgi:hypothetical protein